MKKLHFLPQVEMIKLHRHMDTWIVGLAIKMRTGPIMRVVSGTEPKIVWKVCNKVSSFDEEIVRYGTW